MLTTVRIPKLLLDHLEELTTEQLRRFQWLLVQHERDGSRPIQKSHLEKADIEDIVDKMVQVYGEDGAVEVTLDVLTRMSCFDLACKLTEENARRHEGRPTPENVSSSCHEERHGDFSTEEDLTCRICFQVFSKPVMLQCGHSFCKECVDNYWKVTVFHKCPLCKKFLPDTKPSVNFALKNLIENYKANRSLSNQSGGHEENRESCQTLPKTVKEKQQAFEKIKHFCDASIEHIKTQSQEAQRKMKEDFESLHLFLQEDEATRMAALKQEEMQKTLLMQRIVEMSRAAFSLSDNLKYIEELGADISFVQNFQTELERAQSALSDPQLLPRARINMAEHAENLQLRVIKKLLTSIKNNPAILDPNSSFARGRNEDEKDDHHSITIHGSSETDTYL